MRPILVSAIALMALTGVVRAAPTPGPVPPPKLFLSPSGQPFRLGPDDPDPLKAWFDQVDVKRQGYIDRAEFRDDAARFFKRLDENGDGVIDGFEVSDYETKLAPELAAEAEGPAHVAGGPAEGRRGHRGDTARGVGGRGRGLQQKAIGQLIAEPEPVAGADFNLDSRITLDEWMRATDQRFDLLDEAKTGRLTLDELRARLNGGPKPGPR